jgi:hypothetical protein
MLFQFIMRFQKKKTMIYFYAHTWYEKREENLKETDTPDRGGKIYHGKILNKILNYIITLICLKNT